jgi:hypothetical protein
MPSTPRLDRAFHIFKFEGFDDGFNLLHAVVVSAAILAMSVRL